MAKLIVLGNDGRREYELGDCDDHRPPPRQHVQILDRIVSKEHAQIIRQPSGHFLFRDLGSLNGSFLRGERLGDRLLEEGDELTLGSTQLQFDEPSAADAALERVTIQPAANETLIRQRLKPPPGAHEFLPEREIVDSRSCDATTKSCAWRTSWAARSASRSTSICCSRRSS